MKNTDMRGFSRTMPLAAAIPDSEDKPALWQRILATVLLAGLGVCAGIVFYLFPFGMVLGVVGAICLLYVEATLRDVRLKRIASERTNESICSFARVFDYREVDPWIIRAVWQELQSYCPHAKSVIGFPIRPSDQLNEDLEIDGEELEEIANIISRRTGHSLENTQTNPYYGRVATVFDMVMFMNHQPLNIAP